MTLRKGLARIFCAISLLSFYHSVHADVINFDDIPIGSDGYVSMPISYGNLLWTSNWYVANDALYKNIYGNSYGSPSGENAVFNGYGSLSIGVSDIAEFDFTGASFAGWGFFDAPDLTYSAVTITVEGYNNGTLIASKTMPLTSSGYQWLQADFLGVDEVRLVSSDGGKWWLMDDLTINQSGLPPIAKTEIELQYPFEDALPITMPVSTPAVIDLPNPETLTSANLLEFLDEHGNEFDIGTLVVLKTLAGAADVPVVGVPVGAVIDALLDPGEGLKAVSTGAHWVFEGIQFWDNLGTASELWVDAGGNLENLSNSQAFGFYSSVLENLDIASNLINIDLGPVIDGLSTASGIANDLVDFTKFSTALLANDPVTALLVANEKIWFDWVSDQLGILGKDPIDPAYTQIYIPTSLVQFEVPSTSNQEFQVASEQFLTKSLLYYKYLDALNTTFDRYTAAYMVGDAISATMQLQAWLYYLNLLYDTASETLDALNEFQAVVASLEVTRAANLEEAQLAYSSVINALASQTFSAEVNDFLLETFHLSQEEFIGINDLFLSISQEAMLGFLYPGESVFDTVQSSLVSFIALGERQATVPEPSTILVLMLGLAMLGVIQVARSPDRKHRL